MSINQRRIAVGLLLLVSLGLLATLAVQGLAEQQPARGLALQQADALYAQEIKPLARLVISSYEEYRANTVRWSAAYFGCLFGSALLSAFAALLLKLELLASKPKLRNDLAAAAATIAALLVTLSATGNFQQKWRANRIAASAMENLAYELLRPGARDQVDSVLSQIQAINQARNLGIVGEASDTAATAEPAPP